MLARFLYVVFFFYFRHASRLIPVHITNNTTWAQARRNAMDNASKNAGDMIQRFQILYNRQRQAVITGELVEIITGASASEDM